MLYGIVDIGSNTVKLKVYYREDSNIETLFSIKENLGLVFYITEGKLTRKGIDKLMVTLKEMKNTMDLLKIKNCWFFATAWIRNIENRANVLQIINDKVNIKIDVLSDEEEGKLSFCGSVSTIKEDNGILIDVGGGSVEIVLFENRKIIDVHSISAGALKMYDNCVSDLIPDYEESNMIKNKIYSELHKIGFDNKEKILFICGVGGNLRVIRKLLMDLNLQQNKSHIIAAGLLKQLKHELTHNNKDTYNKILHVKPSKIHTLVPALLILEAVTSYFGCEEIQISKFSVREGYLYKKVLNRC